MKTEYSRINISIIPWTGQGFFFKFISLRNWGKGSDSDYWEMYLCTLTPPPLPHTNTHIHTHTHTHTPPWHDLIISPALVLCYPINFP